MTDNQIRRQEFLLNARSTMVEGQIVCPRCDGFGETTETLVSSREEPCRLCLGQRVIKRRVKVVVDDMPVGVRR
jgi:DnaJ-class molecular chaperone